MNRIILSILCAIAINIGYAQFPTKKTQPTPITIEQEWLSSMFSPKPFGVIPEGTSFVFKESMIKDGEPDIPMWINIYAHKEIQSKEWFKGKELILSKISYKKPKGSSFKSVIWEMKSPDGVSFNFKVGDTLEDIKDRYSVLGYSLDMVLKNDIDDFNKKISGKQVFTNRPLKWTYIDKKGFAPQYIPITLDSCYAGRGNDPVRITATTANGDKIITSTILTYFDTSKELYELNSFANSILLNNPRANYPHINDEMWVLIQNRKIKLGMTREECELAWGEPSRVMRNSGIDNTTTLVYGHSLVLLENGVIKVISE